jgi:hypothetical protein
MKTIELTQGKVALVDDGDFEYLNQFSWHFENGYASRSEKVEGKVRTCKMHRQIMNATQGIEVDHRDHNTLNNQKANLRTCTRSQNQMNRKKYSVAISKFKGVTKDLSGRGIPYYSARISVNGKRVRRRFAFTPEGEIMAAKCYNEMAKKHYGEFAHLNKI